MLNYVWLALIVLGLGAAVYIDINNSAGNKFRNGDSITMDITFDEEYNPDKIKSYNATLTVSPDSFKNFYNEEIAAPFSFKAKVTNQKDTERAALYVQITDDFPRLWITMSDVNGEKDDLGGKVDLKKQPDGSYKAMVMFEEVSFIKLKEVTDSALSYAEIAVEIALGLIGIMALWLGVMKIAEEAGLIQIIARALKPVTRFLFPDVPHDHPAIGSIIMNVSANFLGLGNAATPFGLKAMEELEKLNPKKGTATNAMCLFLAINTAGLTLIPATAIAIRAAAGSTQPAVIIGTAIFGSGCATIVAITAAKIFENFPIRLSGLGGKIRKRMKAILILLTIALLFTVLAVTGILSSIFSALSFLNPDLLKNLIQVISIIAIPLIILVFVTYGIIKKVKVYETFVEGAKGGFEIAIKIIPYLVAMLVGIGIFRAGGAMEFMMLMLEPVTNLIGMPAEALPMAIMRPLSGSGSLGIMAEIIATHGPDSFIGILVSTFFGSTETTFYVLAVYFGSVNIKNTRHALPVGLLADVAGIMAAVFIVRLLFA